MSIKRAKADGEVEDVRPSFIHSKPEGAYYSREQLALQLTQDIRNVLEQTRDKQMLQCDVRADIKRMRIALERIANHFPAKKGRPRK